MQLSCCAFLKLLHALWCSAILAHLNWNCTEPHVNCPEHSIWTDPYRYMKCRSYFKCSQSYVKIDKINDPITGSFKCVKSQEMSGRLPFNYPWWSVLGTLSLLKRKLCQYICGRDYSWCVNSEVHVRCPFLSFADLWQNIVNVLQNCHLLKKIQ